MEVRSYRAKSVQEALRQVRQELGPDAAVLHTREVSPGLWGWLAGAGEVEVTASLGVRVPSRFEEAADRTTQPTPPAFPAASEPRLPLPPAHEHDYGAQFRDDLRCNLAEPPSMVEQLCQRSAESQQRELPQAQFQLLTDLIDVDFGEELARELVARLQRTMTHDEWHDPLLLKARLARLVESEIDCCGPLVVTPGRRRLAALVGPTGVGKTTTVAKLAASQHLHQRRRVGLITVDTYRMAAVDQLRRYAEIIDLPMEVVSTPREMRAALARLADLDLVLIDTAGRSPRDAVRLQELRTLLEEARADEVHLVLSSVASTASQEKSARLFADVGVTALILTKLDEATGLGGLVPLLRRCRLPLSYVTAGQSVPEDIAAADRRRLARIVLGMDTA